MLPPASVNPHEATALALLKEWQEEMRLRDWNITLGIRSLLEMDGDHGGVSMVEAKQCAFIRLLDPREADMTAMEPYDLEVTLVHELLHCQLAPFKCDPGDHRDTSLEQCIHKTSILLVQNKRALRIALAANKRKRAA